MRKIIVVVLCVCVFGMVYLVYDAFSENQSLRSKISEVSDKILQNENEKEKYDSKLEELNNVRELNKDKVSKYDEVETWNQEIIKYLD